MLLYALILASVCFLCMLLYVFIHFQMLLYAFIPFHMLSYVFIRFLIRSNTLSYAFIRLYTLSYAFIRFQTLSICFNMLLLCFYMLFEAVKSYCVTRRRTTTREAASLSNRLLPAEAGKNVFIKYTLTTCKISLQ